MSSNEEGALLHSLKISHQFGASPVGFVCMHELRVQQIANSSVVPLQTAREEQSGLPLSNGTRLTAPQPRPSIARQSAGNAEAAPSATVQGEGEACVRSTADQIWVLGKPGTACRSAEVYSSRHPNQD